MVWLACAKAEQTAKGMAQGYPPGIDPMFDVDPQDMYDGPGGGTCPHAIITTLQTQWKRNQQLGIGGNQLGHGV